MNSIQNMFFKSQATRELTKSNVEKICGAIGNDNWSVLLEKGGEGSKGGKVVGHTKSGKPVYEHQTITNAHHVINTKHSDFSEQAHHHAIMHIFHKEKSKDKNLSPTDREAHKNAAEHHARKTTKTIQHDNNRSDEIRNPDGTENIGRYSTSGESSGLIAHHQKRDHGDYGEKHSDVDKAVINRVERKKSQASQTAKDVKGIMAKHGFYSAGHEHSSDHSSTNISLSPKNHEGATEHYQAMKKEIEAYPGVHKVERSSFGGGSGHFMESFQVHHKEDSGIEKSQSNNLQKSTSDEINAHRAQQNQFLRNCYK